MATAVEMSANRKKGTVRWFNASKGSGFVTPDIGGGYIYFHQPSLKSDGGDGYYNLNVGDSVEFEVRADWDGRPRAFDITAPDGGALSGGSHPVGCDWVGGDACYGGDGDLCYVGGSCYGVDTGHGFYTCGEEGAAVLPVLPEGTLLLLDEMSLEAELAVKPEQMAFEASTVWDDDGTTSHNGLLKQLAGFGCVYYFVDEEPELIAKPDFSEEQNLISGMPLCLDLACDFVDEMSSEIHYDVETFNKLPSKTVIWDEDLQENLDSQDVFSEQHSIDEELKPLAVLDIIDKPSHAELFMFNDSAVSAEATREVFDENHCKVVWDDDMIDYLDTDDGLVQQITSDTEYMDMEKTWPITNLIDDHVLTSLDGLHLFLHTGMQVVARVDEIKEHKLLSAFQSNNVKANTPAQLDHVLFKAYLVSEDDAEVFGNMLELREVNGAQVSNSILHKADSDLYLQEQFNCLGKVLSYTERHRSKDSDTFKGKKVADIIWSMFAAEVPPLNKHCFSPRSIMTQPILGKMLAWRRGNFSPGEREHQLLSHRLTSRQWDPGILIYEASSTYASCQSFSLREGDKQVVKLTDNNVLGVVALISLPLELEVTGISSMVNEMHIRLRKLLTMTSIGGKIQPNVVGLLASSWSKLSDKALIIWDPGSPNDDIGDCLTAEVVERKWANKIEHKGDSYADPDVAWGQATFRRGGSVTYGLLALCHHGPAHGPVLDRHLYKEKQKHGRRTYQKLETEIGFIPSVVVFLAEEPSWQLVARFARRRRLCTCSRPGSSRSAATGCDRAVGRRRDAGVERHHRIERRRRIGAAATWKLAVNQNSNESVTWGWMANRSGSESAVSGGVAWNL